MWVDVERLYEFYATSLGGVVQNTVTSPLEALWRDTRHETVVAFGYGLPFLETFHDRCNRVLYLMPAPLGVCHWPQGGANLTCLCPVDIIPLPDCSVHKILLIHSIEFAPDARALLREAWRVLIPGGEVILFVPNRRGMWASSPTNPFGDGQPYSGRQLFALAESACFFPLKPTYHLFHPPMNPFLSGGAQETIENFGQKWLKKIGGLVMLQAQKKVIANVKERTPSLGRRIFTPEGLIPQKRSLKQATLKKESQDYSTTSGENSKLPGNNA